MKLEPIPYSTSKTAKPHDGFVEKKFIFCDRHWNQNCIKHYQSVSNNEGEYICPYGFSTVVKNLNGKKIVFTSFELEGSIDRKKLKKNKTKRDNKKRFSKADLKGIFDWFINTDASFNAKQNMLRELDRSSDKVSQKKEVMDDTLHELRKLNNILKKQAFFLKSEAGQHKNMLPIVLERAQNILSSSQLVSTRLDAYDFTLNPGIIEVNPKIKTNIYKKFEKARHCLELITKEKNIEIKFSGSSRDTIYCYSIIDILPFILLENAIKFSPKDGTVICQFIEVKGKISEIIVSNKANLPDKKELSKLTVKGYRGSSSQDVSGTGRGLHIAKLICECNNFNLEIITKEENTNSSVISGRFSVKIIIPKPV